MPELPEITVYVERIAALAAGQPLASLRLASPFVLRTVDPVPATLVGKRLESASRTGKRVILGFEGDLYAAMHLMIMGRLKWRAPGAKLTNRVDMLAFDFPAGSLVMSESGTKHRASLHLVSGKAGLSRFDRGGVDIFKVDDQTFEVVLKRQNRTLKRALTDPSIVDGIGNAYSDEILHRARLSPFTLTGSLEGPEIRRLREASALVLSEWTERFRAEAGAGLPEKVSASRPEMAVHGKFGKPCPNCGAPIQHVVYAENEANYCPGCQSGGRIFADRSLSRLLKDDWPKTLEDLEKPKPGTT